jgi:hypothetical protein
VAVLGKTLREADFDGIFTEVPHTESLGLINPNHLRAFHLNVTNNTFSFTALHDFLTKNIGRYVYSRAQLEEFRVKDEMDNIGLKAVGLLRDAYDGTLPDEISNELGDIMLYVFLEQILEAPKLFSRIELVSNGCPKGFGNSGVHLCTLGNSPTAQSYQMVFGKSHIKGVFVDAVDEAFNAIEAIRDDKLNELQLVDSAIFKESFDETTIENLKELILPSLNKPQLNKAFGVFLGYDAGLATATYSNDDFLDQLNWKMREDIKAHITYVAEKIIAANMQHYSFYIYTLPLNDADEDKRRIMTSLLEGRIV